MFSGSLNLLTTTSYKETYLQCGSTDTNTNTNTRNDGDMFLCYTVMYLASSSLRP